MLQGIQTEVGQFGDLVAGGPDAEDSAGILGTALAGEEFVREATVTAWHTPTLREG